jgi:hypothetical protein
MSMFKKILFYATPFSVIKRAFKSVSDAGEGIGKAAGEVVERAKKREEALRVENPAWYAMSSREKWVHAFEAGQWTNDKLAMQMGSFQAAKWVFLVVSIISPALMAWCYYSVPAWLALFLVPLVAVFGGLSVVQFLRHSWWICQIDRREMMLFKEFMKRDDRLVYMFGSIR